MKFSSAFKEETLEVWGHSFRCSTLLLAGACLQGWEQVQWTDLLPLRQMLRFSQMLPRYEESCFPPLFRLHFLFCNKSEWLAYPFLSLNLLISSLYASRIV